MTFNIWNVKNRYLRSAIAWLFAGVAALVVLAALPVALVWLAVAGVYGGLRAVWLDYEWRDLASNFWRAASGKEAV